MLIKNTTSYFDKQEKLEPFLMGQCLYILSFVNYLVTIGGGRYARLLYFYLETAVSIK